MNFRNEVARLISSVLNIDVQEIALGLEIPPEPQLGDFSFPCFKLAKVLRKAPAVIANEIADGIDMPSFLADVKVVGAYVNFFVKRDFFALAVLSKIYEQNTDFGKTDIGKGGVVVIDYSSPNIAKPFHVGHLRSTVIGHALYNIHNYLGYKSFSINYLGDWGTQFGKIIAAYERWGNKDDVNAGGVTELQRLNVKFHEEAEENKALEDEGRAWLLKMQQGDEYALGLWQWFKDVSLKEFERIYNLLEIKFDSYQGESFYNDKMKPVVEELRQKSLLVESDGAMVVDLEAHGFTTPCMILRSDGGTLYATRDITSALHRKSEYNFVKALYVTDYAQNLHFAQFFKVVELMGYDFDMVHVPFGRVSLPDGGMSTRRGRVISMEELLSQSISKIRDIIEEKNPGLANKDDIAQQVGVGAVIFNDLYNGRMKDIEFSWERVLSFEGETGPYVQYTHARAAAVLRKAETVFDKANLALLTADSEFDLIKTLALFPEKTEEAGAKLEPYILSRFVMQLAQAFNKFYHECPILKADEETKKARLFLTHCTKIIIAATLEIIGIKAPDEM